MSEMDEMKSDAERPEKALFDLQEDERVKENLRKPGVPKPQAEDET